MGNLNLILVGKTNRFLIQLTTYEVSLVDLQPLIIFRVKGVHTDEMEDIFSWQ